MTAAGEFIMHRPDAIGIESAGGLREVGVEILRVSAAGEVVGPPGRKLDRRVWIGEVAGLLSTADPPAGGSRRSRCLL